MKALIYNNQVISVESTESPINTDLKWVDITGLTPQPVVKGWYFDNVADGIPVFVTQTNGPAIDWTYIRDIRNKLLTDSDWTRLDDIGMDQTTKDSWATFRQTLRDIPQNNINPEDVIWPEPPV